MEETEEQLGAEGRVKEATRDWTVKTDEVLAHRLQEEEISKHLTGNKSRNELIRVDYPTAAAVQKKVDEQARLRLLKIRKQAEEDAKVAWELQKKQRELRENILTQAEFPSTSQEYLEPSSSRIYEGLVNNNDQEALSAINRSFDRANCSPESGYYKSDIANGNRYDSRRTSEENAEISLREIEVALGVPIEMINEERRRLIQEERDAEIARKLQQSKTFFDTLDESDREYARILQAKEYQKYIRTKEKQRIKAVQKHAAAVAYSAARNSVPDTYCRPVDCVQGAQSDPYYMEPLHAGQHSRQSSIDDRRFRAPPAPPRSTGGRPRMADPVASDNVQNHTERRHQPSPASTQSYDSSDTDNEPVNRSSDKAAKKKASKKDKKKGRSCVIQ